MFKIDQHIEHLLLNHDCVIVPGFGGFVIHNVPAHFDKSDGTIVPPYTTVGFNPQLVLNDSLLIQSFIETYDMSFPEAQREIEQEVEKLKGLISSNGSFEIHSVGTIYINADGNYEFEPCDAGIPVPRFYGLSGINTYNDDAFIPRKELEKVYEEETNVNTAMATIRRIAVACVAIIVIAALPFIAQNNQTQQILSSIDISFIKQMMPNTEVKTPKTTIAKPVNTSESQIVKQEPITKQMQAPSTEAEKQVAEDIGKATDYYTVVLAARVSQVNAEIYIDELKKEGLKDLSIIGEGKSRKVVMGMYSTEEEAQQNRRTLSDNAKFESAWVLKIK